MAIGLIAFLVFLGVVGSFVGRITRSESKPIRILKAFSIYDNLAKILIVPKET